MDRRAWLEERRRTTEAVYDAEGPTYDAHPYPTPLHGGFVRRVAETCPPGGVVLDAACGTGRWFEGVVATGRRVVGFDQSAGMLEQAGRRGLASALRRVGLQEIDDVAAFDAAMAVDVMENIPPEDWPLVLANLHRAVRPGGHLYLTVEEGDEADVDRAYEEAVARGWPAVRGELVEGDYAGYHYYPGRDRVLAWLAAEGLEVVEEAADRRDGYGYRHFLVR